MIRSREQAWRFCQAVRQATTIRALADVVGVSKARIQQKAPEFKGGRRKVSRQVLARMWAEWRSGQELCVYKYVTTDGGKWTQSEIAHLLAETGTCRFALICTDMGRSPNAARIMLHHLRQQGRITQPLEFTAGQLAKALDRTEYWVRDLAKDFTLRSYTDRRGLMIHRHDARWLLDWWDGKSAIPKHPGKSDGC